MVVATLHKIMVMVTAVAAMDMQQGAETVVTEVAVAELLKGVADQTALALNVGAACPGKSVLPSWKHKIEHMVSTTPTHMAQTMTIP